MSTYERCAEAIALLDLMGNVANPPTYTPYIQPSDMPSDHLLSLRTERHLAAELATLSAIEDDVNSVTAVCIQQVDGRLRILVAANATQSCQSDYLRAVKTGFDAVFARLQNAWASKAPIDQSLVRKVYMDIIAMCRERIIARGRLGGKTSKPSFSTLLDRTLLHLQQLRGVGNKPLFQRLLKDLSGQISTYSEVLVARNGLEWEASSLDEELAGIIDKCCELSHIGNWRDILLKNLDGTVPRQDPSDRKAIVNLVEKCSQYRHCAERLVNIFRSEPSIRKATTVLVHLGPAAFHQDSGRRSNLQTVLSRILGSDNPGGGAVQALAGRLSLSSSEATIRFQGALRQARQRPRIHAEVQLVWYLAANSTPTPPRVIASNKDACYLCDALISCHGMYQTPRSHGRIYAGWRLPAEGLESVQEEFVRVLEQRARVRALKVLRSGRKKTDCPVESTINSSMATVVTKLTAGSHGSDQSDSSSSEATVIPSPTSSDTPTQDLAGVSAANSIEITAEEAARADEVVPDEEPWLTVQQGRLTILALSDKLRLHVEYSASTPSLSSAKLRFRVHCLPATEVVAVSEVIYDVRDGLVPLQDVACEKNCRFVHLKDGTEVFRIELGESSS